MEQQQPQTDRTLNKMRDIPARAEEVAYDARAKLNETVEQISGKAKEYVRYADRRVQQNPWTSVGIGFGAGMICGAFMSVGGFYAIRRDGPAGLTGSGLWRYAPMLPIADPAHRVTLGEMMEKDAADACGPRHSRAEARRGYRWGRTRGKVGFHAGKIDVEFYVGDIGGAPTEHTH